MSDEPMTIKEAREKFTVTKVHCPTLHEMTPDFQLLNMACPFDKDGHCRKCEHFAGVYSEDGTFFAHAAYEGFCDHPKEEEETTTCKFCWKETPVKTAHLHQGEYVGECCWDERLRVTE